MGRSNRSETGEAVVPLERIERAILLIRGHKVMLDRELALLYGVSVTRLNEAVKRNIGRFPTDFMFQLDARERKSLTSQFAISKGRGGRRTLPYVFTQEGVAMLSSVLRSPRAVAVNIQIMRAFVRLRQYLASHEELRRKLEELERRLGEHDQRIGDIFDAIHELMETDASEGPPKPRIGFDAESKRNMLSKSKAGLS